MNFGKKSGGSLEKFKNAEIIRNSDYNFIDRVFTKIFTDLKAKFPNDYNIDHQAIIKQIKKSAAQFYNQIKFDPVTLHDADIWPDAPWRTRIENTRSELLRDITIFDIVNTDADGYIIHINNLLFCNSSRYGINPANSLYTTQYGIPINEYKTDYKNDFDNKFYILINQTQLFINNMKTKYNRYLNGYVANKIDADFLPNSPVVFDFLNETKEKIDDCDYLKQLSKETPVANVGDFIFASAKTKIDLDNAIMSALDHIITDLKAKIALVKLTFDVDKYPEYTALANANRTLRIAQYNVLKELFNRLSDIYQNHDIRIPSLESIEKFNQRYSVESEIPGKIGIYYQKDENLPESRSYPNGTIILYPEHKTDLDVGPLIIKSFIENDLKSQCPPDIITKVIQNKIILTPKYIMRNVKDNKLIEFTKTNI